MLVVLIVGLYFLLRVRCGDSETTKTKTRVAIYNSTSYSLFIYYIKTESIRRCFKFNCSRMLA